MFKSASVRKSEMLPLRNKLEWLATAPTPASGGASAMLAATEMVTSIEIYKYFK